MFHPVLKKEFSKLTGSLTCGTKSLYLQKKKNQELQEENASRIYAVNVTRPEKVLALMLITIWSMSWLLLCPTEGLTKYPVLLVEAEIPKFNDSIKVFPFKRLKHR